jgi:putative PIN family toxin of toxin-antitoxin system
VIAAVLDTNVLASGLTIGGSVPDRLIRLAQAGVFEIVLAEPIMTELARTLEKPYFRKRWSADQVVAALDLLRQTATMTPLTAPVQGVATHPEDDLVLATARSGKAAFLVTVDAKLQRLGSYETITILSPRAFLDLLLTQASS